MDNVSKQVWGGTGLQKEAIEEVKMGGLHLWQVGCITS